MCLLRYGVFICFSDNLSPNHSYPRSDFYALNEKSHLVSIIHCGDVKSSYLHHFKNISSLAFLKLALFKLPALQ